jgi:thioredoxin-like negative regulator of GroEL
MAPVVHGLEAEYSGKINFYYLDADDAATLPFQQQFAFRIQPHFTLLDGGGNVLKTWVGPVNEEDFRAAFDAILQ